MKAAVQSLISINEVWEVYRVSKILANLIISKDTETAKKYFNLSPEYYKKLSCI